MLQKRIDKKLTRGNFTHYLRTGQIEARAVGADDETSGGYLIPPADWHSELDQARAEFSPVRQFGTVVPTTRDAIDCPAISTEPTAAWGSDSATLTADSSTTTAQRKLYPKPVRTYITASNLLLRNSPLGDSYVQQILAKSLADAEFDKVLNGVGSELEPLGIFTASDLGVPTSQDVATGNATAITWGGLIDVIKEMPAGSWPYARWIFHPDAIAQIKELYDGSGNLIFDPESKTILSFPYDVSDSCPNTFTENLYVGALVDWRYYILGEVVDPTGVSIGVQVLDELHALTGQTGYIARAEIDGVPGRADRFVRLKCATS